MHVHVTYRLIVIVVVHVSLLPSSIIFLFDYLYLYKYKHLSDYSNKKHVLGPSSTYMHRCGIICIEMEISTGQNFQTKHHPCHVCVVVLVRGPAQQLCA